MAVTLHKFLKKPSALRIITSFNNPQSSKLVTPFLIHESHLVESKSDEQKSLNPFWGSSNTEKFSTSQTPFLFYPSFPFGCFLNPVSVNGVNQLDEVEGGNVEVGDDSKKIWADSVKKKRKKKMNKHKLKKLRKRLRRKT
ncbi:hypothetical protein AQUCO_01100398v1 [Aquilegia coerulea]|uniref:Small ribosomal subunit protein mS38 n=1 Tax=Aquilegia coerulea TaxID=218851 RepID=A0A2G5E6Z7_AQUCA|nr:hypothetical protein AQUCO_01100398v1 [Aquilegia coerulea]